MHLNYAWTNFFKEKPMQSTDKYRSDCALASVRGELTVGVIVTYFR